MLRERLILKGKSFVVMQMQSNPSQCDAYKQKKVTSSSDDGCHLFSTQPLLKLVLTPKIAEWIIFHSQCSTETACTVPLPLSRSLPSLECSTVLLFSSSSVSSSKLLNNTIQNTIYSSSHQYEEVCIIHLDVHDSCFSPICSIMRCGLLAPYGVTEQGQYWLR